MAKENSTRKRVRWRAFVWILGAALVGPGWARCDETPPRSLDPRLKIELFAENPQIVTPTGLDVDARGRVWAIESNTHFPPEGYKGHPTDRLLVMSDDDRDGRADRIVVFTDQLKHAMSVAIRPAWFPVERPGQPAPGAKANKEDALSDRISAYVATRREIRLWHDDDGDHRADRNDLIVHLETKGDYPHNGLAGIAFDALGWMYFGFGENLGADYAIIGSDGTTLKGGGEGGNVYRCRLDGSKLEQWATGFWNPHASCIDAFGRLFTVDNDPDSRPPCRLMHIIRGGDYGYRFRNGRKGLHPFTAWNGEIPGTLPMVAGTGEAPSGILAYESDGLPEEYLGNLLCTSWGDHRVDRFRLKPKGASFESLAEPLIVGGENFRPVGIACAPDGSLYCTDWVLRDYNLHGRGRVWRISAENPHEVASDRVVQNPLDAFVKRMSSPRIGERRNAARFLQSTSDGRKSLLSILADESQSPRSQIEALWALSTLPTDVDRFAFVVDKQEAAKISSNSEEVEVATIDLLGTPQFPYDPSRQSIFGLGDDVVFLFRRTSERRSVGQETLAMIPKFGIDDMQGIDLVIAGGDPFEFSACVAVVGRSGSSEPMMLERITEPLGRLLSIPIQTGTAEHHLAYLLAGRRAFPKSSTLAMAGLADKSQLVRRAAVQWVAEERMTPLRPRVDAILSDPAITADLFLATLAALEMLDGIRPEEFDKTPPGKYVLPLVKDETRPAAVRALALRMVDPAEPVLDASLLSQLAGADVPALRLEAVRTLQQAPVEKSLQTLRRVALDTKLEAGLRAEAVVGLGRPSPDATQAAQTRGALLALLRQNDRALRREALRSLRAFVADAQVKESIAALAKSAAGSTLMPEVKLALDGNRPAGADEAARDALLVPTSKADDPEAGRRTFFHSQSAGCYRCHTVNGRGGRIGPDLSTIGRSLTRERLIDSILEPSREIAPQFVTWSFETAAGKVITGMIVHENEGKTIVGDSEGQLTELNTLDIVSRVPQKTSVMPEKLAARMSPAEFRDLLAFLESLR